MHLCMQRNFFVYFVTFAHRMRRTWRIVGGTSSEIARLTATKAKIGLCKRIFSGRIKFLGLA